MQQSKNLYLRLVKESDVNFILSLRLNKNLNSYLTPVNDNVDEQIKWIKKYKLKEIEGLEYYFIIMDKTLGAIGLVRVYDIDYAQKTFTWGSWILKEDRPKYAAIESAMLSYEFAFNELGLFIANFDVMKENGKVINFHKHFGANYLFSDDVNYYFELTKKTYLSLKYNKYYKFLLNCIDNNQSNALDVLKEYYD